ncbi:hypothetical protein ElyMa_002153400, partial [Elysia marginata]
MSTASKFRISSQYKTFSKKYVPCWSHSIAKSWQTSLSRLLSSSTDHNKSSGTSDSDGQTSKDPRTPAMRLVNRKQSVGGTETVSSVATPDTIKEQDPDQTAETEAEVSKKKNKLLR